VPSAKTFSVNGMRMSVSESFKILNEKHH